MGFKLCMFQNGEYTVEDENGKVLQKRASRVKPGGGICYISEGSFDGKLFARDIEYTNGKHIAERWAPDGTYAREVDGEIVDVRYDATAPTTAA